MENYQTFSCRLNETEQFYIKKHWDNSFSSYVHNSIKRDIELSHNNRKQNILSDFTQQIIMLGLGAIFIFFSLGIATLLGFLMIFLLGVFFIVTSLVNIYIRLYKKWKMNSLTRTKT